jgi:hypothetical protein
MYPLHLIYQMQAGVTKAMTKAKQRRESGNKIAETWTTPDSTAAAAAADVKEEEGEGAVNDRERGGAAEGMGNAGAERPVGRESVGAQGEGVRRRAAARAPAKLDDIESAVTSTISGGEAAHHLDEDEDEPPPIRRSRYEEVSMSV